MGRAPPCITWNEANEARLLRALVAVLNANPNEAAAQEIADIMGDGVTPSAIKRRLGTYRTTKLSGSGAALVSGPMTPKKSSGIVKQTPTPRCPKASPTKTSPAKQKRLTKLMNQDDSDAESMASGDDDVVADVNDDSTAKSTRARRSMTAAAKKINYAQLDDPHADEVSDDDKGTKREREEDPEPEGQLSVKAPKLTENVGEDITDHIESGFGVGV